jgi:hypothetical protein
MTPLAGQVLQKKIDRGLGVLGTLHIDSNEIVQFTAYLQNSPQVGRANFLAYPEAQLGELNRNL